MGNFRNLTIKEIWDIWQEIHGNIQIFRTKLDNLDRLLGDIEEIIYEKQDEQWKKIGDQWK